MKRSSEEEEQQAEDRLVLFKGKYSVIAELMILVQVVFLV